MTSTRIAGAVCNLSRKQLKFGHIRGDDGGEYFFHRTFCIPPELFEDLAEGTRVSFEKTRGPKGMRAVEVRRAGGNGVGEDLIDAEIGEE